jgi:hypothetical protein
MFPLAWLGFSTHDPQHGQERRERGEVRSPTGPGSWDVLEQLSGGHLERFGQQYDRGEAGSPVGALHL